MICLVYSPSRPKKLDDVSHQEEVVEALKNTLNTGNLPHLLFYGPPGTGKTSTILAVARDLFGPDLMKTRVLELNASHERGIDVIRDKVKSFAQIAIGSRDNAEGYPCPPFKIIILDEADCMTKDAQSALRRTMENYAKVTRFCIICNYVSRIIEPITSRCAKFRYKSLSEESMLKRLQYICSAEAVVAQDNALRTLISVSDGDLRKAITLLQTSTKLVLAGDELTEDIVLEVSGSVPTPVVEHLWSSALTGDVRVIQKAVQEVILMGYPVDQVLQRLLQVLLRKKAANTLEKVGDFGLSQLVVRMAAAERRLVDGANEEAQLGDIMSVAVQVIAQGI